MILINVLEIPRIFLRIVRRPISGILFCPSTSHRSAWGNCGTAPIHFDVGTRWGWSSQRHSPAALYHRRKEPRYFVYRRLGGPL